jgi:hypothetical protein
VWSLGTAGGIERFPVMLSVGELVVLADYDELHVNTKTGEQWRPGIRAAQNAVRTWRAAGWSARYVAPDNEGDDFADVAEAREKQKEAAHG